ncbi:MAG: glycosyltransferase involved in cell wall biosynthesis [Motiliproteus sp.]|jgi:glycosyltransferase involved in cell wall biosynthesis
MSRIPLVSVIIPSFNSRTYIAEAVDSILAQGVEDIEIIIVDDGSTDDSAMFIKSYTPLVCIIFQKNAGPAAARNRGIREAKGRYLAFLDADDVWVTGKLAAQLAFMEENPTISICYGSFRPWLSDTSGLFSPPTDISPVSSGQQHNIDNLLPMALLFDAVVWTPTVFARSESVKDLLQFDEQLDVGEDYDLWLRLSLQLRFGFMPVTVALYRDNPASITKKIPRRNFEKIVVMRAVQRFREQAARGLIAYMEPAIEARLADLEYSYGRGCFMARRREDAREELASLLGRKFSLGAWLMHRSSCSSALFKLIHRLLQWRRNFTSAETQ